MTITLHLHDGRTAKCHHPRSDLSYVIADGLECECSRGEPLAVSGGAQTETERRSEASAACARCRGSVGRLVVEYDTIFGITEDRAVICGRPRVY